MLLSLFYQKYKRENFWPEVQRFGRFSFFLGIPHLQTPGRWGAAIWSHFLVKEFLGRQHGFCANASRSGWWCILEVGLIIRSTMSVWTLSTFLVETYRICDSVLNLCKVWSAACWKHDGYVCCEIYTLGLSTSIMFINSIILWDIILIEANHLITFLLTFDLNKPFEFIFII